MAAVPDPVQFGDSGDQQHAGAWVPAFVQFKWTGEVRTPRVMTTDLGGERSELVRIPKGTFRIGSPDSDKDAHDAEKPRPRVELTEDCYSGKSEVTGDEFDRFVAETGYRTEAEHSGDGGEEINSRRANS